MFVCVFSWGGGGGGGGLTDRRFGNCNPDNEKIWTILTAKVSDFFITSQDQS